MRLRVHVACSSGSSSSSASIEQISLFQVDVVNCHHAKNLLNTKLSAQSILGFSPLPECAQLQYARCSSTCCCCGAEVC
jgi:hypothetical protein